MTFTQKLRANVFLNAIDKNNLILNGHSILDVGCGNGVVSNEIMKMYDCKLTGTDTIEYLNTPINFKLMNQDNILDFDDKSFDTGLLIDVLHHIPYKKQMQIIEETLRVCRTVIIFEDKPTLLLRFTDYLINQIHNKDMAIVYAFRINSEWIRFFRRNNINAKEFNVKKGIYPFEHYLFQLK